MASNDHAQAVVPDPAVAANDSVYATPGPTQESQQQVLESTQHPESSELQKDPPSDNTQQDNLVTENISLEGNGDNTATASPAIASPDELGEQKVATPAPGLSSKQSDSSLKESEDSGPSLTITLLLITGSRHPFKIDGKYLRKRSVNVENSDPFAMSVYTLKELIWREWRQDWETRPSSPSSIRLISFGKLLDDKAPLSDSKFSRDAPNVVHMTVKPQEIVDEEDAKGTKTQLTRDREASERSPRCRCVIQ